MKQITLRALGTFLGIVFAFLIVEEIKKYRVKKHRKLDGNNNFNYDIEKSNLDETIPSRTIIY